MRLLFIQDEPCILGTLCEWVILQLLLMPGNRNLKRYYQQMFVRFFKGVVWAKQISGLSLSFTVLSLKFILIPICNFFYKMCKITWISKNGGLPLIFQPKSSWWLRTLNLCVLLLVVLCRKMSHFLTVSQFQSFCCVCQVQCCW